MLKKISFIFLLVLLLTACAAGTAPVATIAVPTDVPLSTPDEDVTACLKPPP